MITEISEYKGSPVFVIKKDADDKYPFSFGCAKAKLMIENIEAIKAFVAECDTKKTKQNKI